MQLTLFTSEEQKNTIPGNGFLSTLTLAISLLRSDLTIFTSLYVRSMDLYELTKGAI